MPSDPPDGLSGYAGLDKKLEHRVRLAASVLLSRQGELTFRRLKDLLGQTDGSLGSHLRTLEDAGYIEVRKEFVDRKPVSWYRLTPAGRRALDGHIAAMQTLLAQANGD